MSAQYIVDPPSFFDPFGSQQPEERAPRTPWDDMMEAMKPTIPSWLDPGPPQDNRPINGQASPASIFAADAGGDWW